MNVLKNKVAKLAEYDVLHHASLLKWTTLIIWACSLVAEVGTFAFNKKLPDKEKSFIIKQELTAGGINLAIMYLLADSFEKAGAWLVNKAKLLPEELPAKFRTEEAVQKILDKDVAFLNSDTKWINKMGGFRKGVSVLAGTIGTIIAFNITSPFISNKIASYFQNKDLAKKAGASTIVPKGFNQLSQAPNFSITQTNCYPFTQQYRFPMMLEATPFRTPTGLYGNIKK